MTRSRPSCVVFIGVAIAASLLATRPAALEPTHADLAYGPHERQRLDLYLVPTPDHAPGHAADHDPARSPDLTPLLVFIHGGGFVRGDKAGVPDALVRQLHAAGISVAAINYRFVTTDALPAAMHDGARAIQFLRAHADDYGLDPDRVAAMGGSAGAGIALWLAMHDDLADPTSDDPVDRQSTRLRCAVVSGAQVSYDPRFWVEIGLERGLEHSSFPRLYARGLSEAELVDAYERSSPITFLSADDPPMWLRYGIPDEVTEASTISELVHHPRHGLVLRERCEPLGVTCVVRYPGGPEVEGSAVEFLLRQLTRDLTRETASGMPRLDPQVKP